MLCLTTDDAERLRTQVAEMVTDADSMARAVATKLGLRLGAGAETRIERGARACRAAATAYARFAWDSVRAVVPVAVVRVGDRIVVADPTPSPTSEWGLAVVFSRKYQVLSRFTF